MEFVIIAVAVVVVALLVGVGLLVGRGRRTTRLDEGTTAPTLTRPRPTDEQSPTAPPTTVPRSGPRTSPSPRCSCRRPSPSRG